jgi:hypothetical protein
MEVFTTGQQDGMKKYFCNKEDTGNTDIRKYYTIYNRHMKQIFATLYKYSVRHVKAKADTGCSYP